MSRWLDNAYAAVVGRHLYPFYETALQRRGTFRYHAEALRSQWDSPEEIAARQWEQLAALLRHAYDTTEYYRSVFDDLGMRPEEVRTPDDFARLPVLDKPLIRSENDRLISSRFRNEELVWSYTGGSTGSPLQFFYNRDSYERRLALAMRSDSWAGWEFCAPEFYIWGVTLTSQNRLSALRTRAYHAAIRRSSVNCFNLNPESLAEAVARYGRLRPRVVVGYANAVYEFARYARDAGIRLDPPRGVICSSEKLYPYQRELIEEVFGTRVFERYGCRETMLIGAECDRHEGLHQAVENVYVEIVRDGRLCGPGEVGEILLTDLHNYGMPFIRYKIGDRGSWSHRACSCGRALPLLNSPEGRSLDVILVPDGRIIPGMAFPHLFSKFSAVRNFQVLQETATDLKIQVKLDRPLAPEDWQDIREAVQRTVGPEMCVAWEVGEEVEIERTNKFRPVRSLVAAQSGRVAAP